MTRREGEPGCLYLPDRRRLRLSGTGRAIREFPAAAGGDPVAAGRDLRCLPVLKVMGLSNDVYAQIGLVMLVGLLGKNAILIVEFAVQRRQEGLSIQEAAIEGGKLRFRPILMTSFAFIAGLLPLVVATGPGAIGNRTIGTAAVGGMLLGTLIGVLVIPGLYYVFGVRLPTGANSSRTRRMNLLLRSSNTKHKKHAIATAIVCSVLLGAAVLNSQSPKAEPGPPLPGITEAPAVGQWLAPTATFLGHPAAGLDSPDHSAPSPA